MGRKVYLLGAFPPPLHGMAYINASVRIELSKRRQAKITSLNIAPRNLSPSYVSRCIRFFYVCKEFFWFLLSAPIGVNSTLYVGLSGGMGQLYEICFIAVARIFKFSIFLHHHSFAYLNKPNCITRLMIKISGKKARHIVLCKCMGQLLINNYGSSLSTVTISNAAIIDQPKHSRVKQYNLLKNIGFFGNISEEKGIFLYIDIMDELNSRGVPVTGLIAGPFQDRRLQDLVFERISGKSYLRYLGSKYGDEKERFFDLLDVLVFPTRYVNEAEPLTILEVMSRGIPVLSINRGCISEMIPSSAGVVLNDDPNVSIYAADNLMAWHCNPRLFSGLSKGALDTYLKLRNSNLARFNALCGEIIGS